LRQGSKKRLSSKRKVIVASFSVAIAAAIGIYSLKSATVSTTLPTQLFMTIPTEWTAENYEDYGNYCYQLGDIAVNTSQWNSSNLWGSTVVQCFYQLYGSNDTIPVSSMTDETVLKTFVENCYALGDVYSSGTSDNLTNWKNAVEGCLVGMFSTGMGSGMMGGDDMWQDWGDEDMEGDWMDGDEGDWE